MTDRDPLTYLSAIDGAEQPDPEFARELLDSLLSELSSEAGGAGSVVQLVDVDPDTPVQTRRKPGFGSWILGAAAALLLVAATIALTRDSDEGTSNVFAGGPEPVPTPVADPTPTPTPTIAPALVEPGPAQVPSAENVAQLFIQTRADGEAAALRSLVADDAAISNEFAVVGPDDLGVRTTFDQAMGTQFVDVDCSELTAEIVSCEYSLETDLGRALRLGPYRGYTSVFTIRDGVIRELVGAPSKTRTYEISRRSPPGSPRITPRTTRR